MLVRISRSARADAPDGEIYQAARRWWRISALRREGGASSPTHALAVIGGKVVGAYRIRQWHTRDSDGRSGFDGEADPATSAKYLGEDVRSHFPPGTANPVRFINCTDEPAPAGPDLQTLRNAAVQGPSVDDLDKALSHLESDPLAALMYGQRELFHSNLLSWFYNALPQYADEVFKPMSRTSNSTKREVWRERNSVDLWFNWPSGESLAIENKVFSLPDREQLDRYSGIVQHHRPGSGMVLLSLSDPGWPPPSSDAQSDSWTFKSHASLAEDIARAIAKHDHSYEAETMRRYAEMTTALDRVVQACMVNDLLDPVALPTGIRERIPSAQLLAAVGKMRAQHVAALVAAAARTVADVDVTARGEFSHGQPAITFAFEHPTIAVVPPIRIGYQLQSGQFRLMAILPHLAGKTAESRDARFHWARTNPDVFDLSTIRDVIEAQGPEMPRSRPGESLQLGRFDPDFVYRYLAAPELVVQQLIDTAILLTKRV